MTEPSREELLSAYLDDELSPDQRAQVEQWLLDSAELRQVFNDLRNVRKDVQSLPRHTLPEDLGPAVLQRAERAVLSGKPATTADGSVTPGSAVAQWWSRAGSKRMLIWPAVAVAAALLVALFDVGRDEREVAQQVEPKEGSEHVTLTEAPSGATISPPEDAAAGEEGDADQAMSIVSSPNPERLAMPPTSPPADESASTRAGNAVGRERGMLRGPSLPDKAREAMQPTAGAEFGAVGQQVEQKVVQALKMETNIRRALANREQVNFIQCDVVPDFISGNEMEKVLKTNGAKYMLIAEPNSGNKNNRYASPFKAPRNLAEQRFAVEATPEQVEKIVTELDEQRERKQVSNMILGLQEQPSDLKSNAPNAAPQQQANPSELLKRQALTIYLRRMDETAPAAPAAAEPAKK